MTPEERQLLTDLANKVAQTPAPAPDPEAQDFIRTHIGNRPDALYMMTQTVLIQNMAIDHAKQEIEEWKQRASQAPAQAPQGQGGFLGRGTGWAAQPPPQQPSYGAPPPGYGPPPQQSGPGGFFGGGGGGGGMGSFLKTAGTTAAGVAAGALAFEGIRSMFGGAEHLMGFGNQPHMGGSGFLGGGGPGGESIVNNYYDRPDERSAVADNLGPDGSVQYDDADVPVDDSSADDSSSDDSSNDSSSDDLV